MASFSSEPVIVALSPSAVLAAVVTALSAFNVWTPTPDQYTSLLGLVAVLTAIGAVLARKNVTPTSK